MLVDLGRNGYWSSFKMGQLKIKYMEVIFRYVMHLTSVVKRVNYLTSLH